MKQYKYLRTFEHSLMEWSYCVYTVSLKCHFVSLSLHHRLFICFAQKCAIPSLKKHNKSTVIFIFVDIKAIRGLTRKLIRSTERCIIQTWLITTKISDMDPDPTGFRLFWRIRIRIFVCQENVDQNTLNIFF